MENEVKKKSLKVNYIYNFISQIITLIIPLITIPYLSRVFHEDGNGRIAFAETIVSYFIMLANLGFSTYGQREIAKNFQNKVSRSKVFWEIVLLRLLFTFGSFTILILTNLIDLYGSSYQTLIYIYGIQVIAVIFDFSFFFQGLEDFKTIAIRTTILRILCLILIFIFVKDENDLGIYVLIYSLSILLSNLIMIPRLVKFLCKIPFKDLNFKKHLLPAFIIFLPTLTVTIYGSLDKLMIRYLAENPDYNNGCYTQALKINQTVLVLIIVIESVMVARNSTEYGKKNFDAIRQNVKFGTDYVLFIGLPLIAGMCITATNISSWFLGDGYDEVPLLLCIMSSRFITSGLASVYGNQLFISIGKEKLTTIAHVATALINLCLNFVFIPRFGAVGGAITTAIAESIDFIFLFGFAIKYKWVRVSDVLKSSLKPFIATLIMTLAIYFISINLSYSIFTFLLITFSGGIIYLLVLVILKDKFLFICFKKVLIPVYRKFKKGK